MPLLLQLDEVLDKRLVRTFVQCLVAIIRFRNNPQALWLSKLGPIWTDMTATPPGGGRNQAGGEAVAVGEMDGGTPGPLSAGESGRGGEEAQRAGETDPSVCGMEVWWKKQKVRNWKDCVRSYQAKRSDASAPNVVSC